MKLAYVLSHPIQYQSPLIRHLVNGCINLRVLYATGGTDATSHDREFGMKVRWDVPLLEGYDHHFLSTSPLKQDPGSYEQSLAVDFDAHPVDAIWVHGWHHPSARAAWSFAKKRNLPMLLRGETHLGALIGGPLQRLAHRLILSFRFRQPSAFLSVGTANQGLYQAYGVPKSKLFSMPYAVDNAFFQERARAAKSERESLRARLGLPSGAPVVLFCGKLIAKKNAETLIRAFASPVAEINHTHSSSSPARPTSLNPSDSMRPRLLIVGQGELRAQLEALADQLAPGRVHFTGFKNQTELPALYDLCDLFVIPSLFEPWGLVVNEVMNAGKPVLASDRVGAAADLIQQGVNGAIFPAGDAHRLAELLRDWLCNPARLLIAGQASLARINQWGFEEDLEGLKAALNHLNQGTN